VGFSPPGGNALAFRLLSSDPHRFEPVVRVWAAVGGAPGDHTCVGTSFGDALLAQGPPAVGTPGEFNYTTLALLRYEKGRAVRHTLVKCRGPDDCESAVTTEIERYFLAGAQTRAYY